MEQRDVRRRQVFAWIVALTCGLALVGAGPLVSATRAAGAELDKGAFKSGCESGGGSYIENNDGSFQCNLKSGGTIKCPDTKSQCTYTQRLSPVGTIRVPTAGVQAFLVAPPDEGSASGDAPAPAPDKHHKHHKHGKH